VFFGCTYPHGRLTSISTDVESQVPANSNTVRNRNGIFYLLGALVVGVAVAGLLGSSLKSTIPVATEANVEAPKQQRNVIFLIPDGAGPATWTFARDCRDDNILHLDNILVGTLRTFASDTLVTDSAASATAYASAVKTYNGAIGMDDEVLPVGTLFEAAKKKSMVTGTVVTTRVTHATPACFGAHVAARSQENEIARQYVDDQHLDFVIGGGRQHFQASYRNSTGSDSRDLIGELQRKGYDMLQNRNDFNRWAAAPAGTGFPVYGLFAQSSMHYEIDRRWDEPNGEPSLLDMTAATLRHLEARAVDGPGFMIMIEGSRIDHAAHANDGPGHLHDAWIFDDTVQLCLEFAAKHPGTLIVSAADHETGGLTLGRDGIYEYYPERIKRVLHTQEFIADRLWRRDPIIPTFLEETGITLTPQQEAELAALIGVSRSNLEAAIGRIISRHALIAWTTSGHTAADINLYAFGRGEAEEAVEKLRNNHDNTYPARVIEEYLGLDLDEITRELRQRTLPPAALEPMKFDWHDHALELDR
jgi:alkaline phosphatase